MKRIFLILLVTLLVVGCGREQQPLAVANGLPDLIVVGFYTSESTIRVNEELIITAVVRNDGTAASSTTMSTLIVDRGVHKNVIMTPALGVKEEIEITFSFTFNPMTGFSSNVGLHRLMVAVNKIDNPGKGYVTLIPELNTDNNNSKVVMINVLSNE